VPKEIGQHVPRSRIVNRPAAGASIAAAAGIEKPIVAPGQLLPLPLA